MCDFGFVWSSMWFACLVWLISVYHFMWHTGAAVLDVLPITKGGEKIDGARKVSIVRKIMYVGLIGHIGV